MAFIPVADCAKVEVAFLFNGQPGVNVLHFDEGAAPTTALLTSMLTAVQSAYHTHLMDLKATTFDLVSFTATDLTTQTGPQVVLPDSTAGASDVEPSTAELNLVVNLLTDLRGRSFRGRVFDCGWSQATFGKSGVIPTAAHDLIQLRWEAFRSDVLTAGFPMQVVSYTANKAPRLAGLASAVTAVRISGIAGVQRRRLRA